MPYLQSVACTIGVVLNRETQELGKKPTYSSFYGNPI